MSDTAVKWLGAIVLVAALVVLIGLMWWGYRGNREVVVQSESAITSFEVDENNFIVRGRGLSSVEIFRVTPESEAAASETISVGTAVPAAENTAENQTWTLVIPEDPFLAIELVAVGYDEAQSEVARMSFAETGVSDIYSALFLEIPFEEIVLSVGQSQFVDNAFSLRVIGVTSDTRCPQGDECADKGSVTASIEISTRAGSETFSLSNNGSGRPFNNHYIELVEVVPEKTSSDSIPQTEYQLTFRISEDIKL